MSNRSCFSGIAQSGRSVSHTLIFKFCSPAPSLDNCLRVLTYCISGAECNGLPGLHKTVTCAWYITQLQWHSVLQKCCLSRGGNRGPAELLAQPCWTCEDTPPITDITTPKSASKSSATRAIKCHHEHLEERRIKGDVPRPYHHCPQRCTCSWCVLLDLRVHERATSERHSKYKSRELDTDVDFWRTRRSCKLDMLLPFRRNQVKTPGTITV